MYDPRVSQVVDFGKKAWNAVQQIRKFINVEEKMFDSNNSAVVTWSGTVNALSNVAEGNDYLNRDGNSILIQKVQVRCQVWGNGTETQGVQPPVLRVMLLRDMLQTAGAKPASGDIIETTGATTAPFSPLAHRHDGNPAARRFRILADKTVAIRPPYGTTIATTGTGHLDLLGIDNHVWTWEIPVNAHTLFSSTAGADASDYVGALYLFVVSNIQTNGPNFLYYSRVFFTDN